MKEPNYVWEKIKGMFKSRKFWALLVALVGIASALSLGEITTLEGLQAAIIALGVYSTGVAIEDAGGRIGGSIY